MERCKRIFLIIITLFTVIVNCFAYEKKIDDMIDVWIDKENPHYIFSISKINDVKYFVSYVDYLDNHEFDFSGVATVVDDEKLFIRISDDRFFYIYLDYIDDNILVLWNHDYIGEYDDYLERASIVYDEKYQIQKRKDYEEQLYKAVIEYLSK